MKKLHITLIALFMLFAAQAQTVTEKDLLGEWTPSKLEMQGTTINFKTGDVTFSKEVEEEATAGGQDIEEVKEMVKEGLAGQGIDKVRVVFKPGMAADFHKEDSVKNLTYTLKEENGATILTRSDGKIMVVSLKDGFLQIVPEGQDGAGGPSIFFEKKK